MQPQPALCKGLLPTRLPPAQDQPPQALGALPGTLRAVTVGAGVEPQAERGIAAVQSTVLRAHTAVGPAHLCAACTAAPGCVVRAGETIKLQ